MSADVSTRHCAVIGQPVAHSLSPRLHAAFARQCDLALDYQRLDISAAQFAASVAAFFDSGGLGLNVTLPHKQAAYALASRSGALAQAAQAANTLSWRDGVLHADNTDGLGLVRDLQRLHIPLSGAHILLLGAGGASAGVLPALLQQDLAHITLRNRSAEKAQALCRQFADPRLQLQLAAAPVDLVISSVSAGFESLLADLTVRPRQVYDLNYGARAQESMQWAKHARIAHVDGIGMLIEQAAESFYLWHGLRPDTGPLHAGAY